MKAIRVRFAPSPTGYLHVGGLRTALFNYLFAKANNGTFVLRIEDTDRERFVEGATENLIHSLRSLGLNFDEGPDCGGSHAPYVQSRRLPEYNKEASRLLEEGKAYRCFCSTETLDEMREQQRKRKLQPRYDGRCRRIDKEESAKRADAGEKFVIRMKVDYSKTETKFEDIIRGEVLIKTTQLEDQVLIKSDGYPTYHLANVVDDHSMEISHVIRGEEWLPSTPKHIMLYDYLGWEPPKFAHLPLLLNPDRSKLSKRQGDVATEDFIKKGFLPEALLNFIVLLGWSNGDDREFFTLAELEKLFSLERCGKAGAVFDVQKLTWMNKNYMSDIPEDKLMERFRPFLGADILSHGDEKVLNALKLVLPNINLLSEAKEKIGKLLSTPEAPKEFSALDSDDAKKCLRVFIEEAEQFDADWTEENFMALMKTVQKSSGLKGKNLWIPLRLAITGEEHGPELPKMAAFYGKAGCIEKVLARLS